MDYKEHVNKDDNRLNELTDIMNSRTQNSKFKTLNKSIENSADKTNEHYNTINEKYYNWYMVSPKSKLIECLNRIRFTISKKMK